MLLLKSSHSVVQLTPDNTAHWGDNTLCLLGANWLLGELQGSVYSQDSAAGNRSIQTPRAAQDVRAEKMKWTCALINVQC